MKRLSFFWLILLLVACSSPTPQATVVEEPKDPLPSWNDSGPKQTILDFVADVTNSASPNFIPVKDRIATFDNDGTLWSEQPLYFQFFFVIDRIKQLAPDHPEWQTKQPYKAAIEGKLDELMAQGTPAIMELLVASHTNITADDFDPVVKAWMTTAKHPRFDRPFTDLIFQPMLELLAYLRAHEFKTFIVSGGSIEFMRPWAEDVYGFPKDQIVGSSFKSQFVLKDGKPAIERLPEIEFVDDKEGKPVGIDKYIGRKPVFAAGNSDGDLAMLQYTASGEGKRFMLYVHHTDPDREWAYDRESHIGALDKGLDEAIEKGWTVVDMKNDWKVIYPFELGK